MRARALIDLLKLAPHVEGGHCREIFRSEAWQAAEPLGAFAYVGATAGPGFEFADFAVARDGRRVMDAIARQQPALARLAGKP
jgi:uncharacterized protein